MPIFAPVYRPKKHQETFLARQQKLESKNNSKKRKRGADSSSDDDVEPDDDDAPRVSSSPEPPRIAFHPVNRTDPYHIAGHSREEPLPLPPFPHAALKESKTPVPQKSLDEKLASLNPPLHVLPPATSSDDKPGAHSLKRRHLDNLTTILHRCMLKGDWKRAERAWGLLIRTEIAGRGVDVRRNGRWGIGAEVLMRRNAEAPTPEENDGDDGRESLDSEDEAYVRSRVAGSESSPFSDQGFKLAREYYERLILQYPHTPRTQNLFNALTVYPALFNVWIYEVQDRSNRARSKLSNLHYSLEDSNNEEDNFDERNNNNITLNRIRTEELQAALPIAERMDQLLLSPPYDTSTILLQLRGMVALWIADLYSELADLEERDVAPDGDGDVMDEVDAARNRGVERYREVAEDERERAREVLGRVESVGVELPMALRGV